MKKFNITGACIPDRHYMVNITRQLNEIKTLIDDGEYFTINRARQYGKTTTLHVLEDYLQNDYTMAGMFGFIKNENGSIMVANRIFETRIYNRFLSTEDIETSDMHTASLTDKNQFTTGGHLNMRLILEIR